MKKLILTCALAVSALTPALATAADPAPGDFKNAAKYCKALKAASGSNFASMFGTKKNAYGKCVSQTAKQGKQSKAKQQDRINAAQTCKQAKKDDPAQFEKDYGSRRNAFGKCVSQTAKQLAAERKQAKHEQPKPKHSKPKHS
jgi:opacity protein-like surface antigen